MQINFPQQEAAIAAGAAASGTTAAGDPAAYNEVLF